MHQSTSTESASPGGRRLSRSFHSCLRGADNDDQESGTNSKRIYNINCEKLHFKYLFGKFCEKFFNLEN